MALVLIMMLVLVFQVLFGLLMVHGVLLLSTLHGMMVVFLFPDLLLDLDDVVA